MDVERLEDVDLEFEKSDLEEFPDGNYRSISSNVKVGSRRGPWLLEDFFVCFVHMVTRHLGS